MSTLARSLLVFQLPSLHRATCHMWMELGADWSGADLQTAANAIMTDAGMISAFEDIYDAGTSWLVTETQSFDVVADVQSPTGFRPSPTSAAFVSTGPSIVGTNAGTPLPPQCSVVVTLMTDLPGPRHRGRVYLPPPTEASVTNQGTLEPTLVTLAHDFVDAWRAVIAGMGFGALDPVVLSSTVLNGETTGIRAVRVNPRIRSQRRRQTRV